MSLVATDLTRRFGDTVAVDHVSFDLPAGEVIGLLGPNGAGKSTTIRMAMGLLEPDSGTVTWNGHGAAQVDRTIVGYLPEEIGLYERMTVRAHIAFFCELQGRSRADARAAAGRWIERLELKPDALVSSLSKGNQQRVQLASSLAHDPELIVLDEPFSGLDPIGQALVEDVMVDLARAGATLVLSSHDLERVERFCSYVALIAAGKLRYDGSVTGLRDRHADLRLLRLELAEPCPALEQSMPVLVPSAAARAVGAGGPAAAGVLPSGAESLHTVLDAPALQLEPEALLRAALDAGARVRGLSIVEPTMRELFVREVKDPEALIERLPDEDER